MKRYPRAAPRVQSIVCSRSARLRPRAGRPPLLPPADVTRAAVAAILHAPLGDPTGHEALSVYHRRTQVAEALGGEEDLPGGGSRPPTQVLLPRLLPLSVGRWAPRRAPRGLPRHRHFLALQAHARVQRAPLHGLGRLRPAGGGV